MSLIRNILKPLSKNVLIPLRLTVAASAADAAIHWKMFRSGCIAKISGRKHPSDLAKRTTLIISNKEMNDVMKIIKPLEESGLLIKSVSETIKNEAKEQKGGLLGMLLGTLGASLLRNLLIGKGKIRADEGAIAASRGQGTNRDVEGIIRAGQVFNAASSFKKFWNTKLLSKET